jgi:hypothetical protein
MRIGRVGSSEIASGGWRLTGGFYLSEDELAARALRRFSKRSTRLHELVSGRGIFRGPIFKRVYVEDPALGLPYVSPNDLDRIFVEPSGFLSHHLPADLLEILELHERYTLVTCSGMSLGKALLVRKDMRGLIASHDLIRIEASGRKIPSGYLYAFLAGRHGRTAVRKQTYGGSVKHIEPEHLFNLGIPRIGDALEKVVHQLVKSFSIGMAYYVTEMRAATSEVLERCNLSSPDPFVSLIDQRHIGWSERKCTSESLRAMNYDPRAMDIRDSILQGKHSPLGALCEPSLFKGKIVFTRIDAEPEHAALLVGQRNAFRPRPNGRWISKKSIRGLGLQVPAGTTLIPSHGTLGENELYCRALFVTPRTSRYAFSGDFFRCVPLAHAISPGYLFSFLRSEPAFRLLRATSAGSKQQYQHPDMMRDLPIPRLDVDVERSIDKRVALAVEIFDRALEAEAQAIGLVDHAIEKGAS